MCTIVIGSFDGVHLGHQAVVKAAIDCGERVKVITFEPIPRQLFGKSGWRRRLTIPEERCRFLGKLGISEVCVVPFDSATRELDPADFLWKNLNNETFSRLVIGYDFHFGKDRIGGKRLLENWCMEKGKDLIVVPPVENNGNPVKSQWIRDLLLDGKLDKASKLLGRRYSLSGIIVRGRKEGRRLGFPTMNIRIPCRKLVPPSGSYSGRVVFRDSVKDAAIYISSCTGWDLEVHIPGFRDETYGEKAEVLPECFLRPQEKGLSREKLIKKIKADVEKTVKAGKSWQ